LATARAGLAQAETAFLAAKKAWTRAQQLHKERILSDADFDTAESTYRAAEAGEKSAREAVAAGGFAIESAQASVQEARDNLSRTILRAPQDGTITALAKEVGESVQGTGFMAGEIIMKVSDLGAMEVHVEVNESDIVRVGLGDSVDVEVDAYRETTFKGTVVEIGNTALNATGAAGLGMDQVTNFSVKIRIDPASYAALAGSDSAASPFRPGMSATVEILTDRASGALSVPLQAVTTRGEGDESTTGVFVSSDGKAVWTPVRTGLQDSRHIVVVSGLEATAEVITGPYETISRTLTDGDAITTGKKDDAAPVP
jgi:HlyD family secretion protein